MSNPFKAGIKINAVYNHLSKAFIVYPAAKGDPAHPVNNQLDICNNKKLA